MNSNKRAVVITRTNSSLNFGQTLDVLESTRTNAVVRPDGQNVKYKVDISEIWFCDLAHEYEEFNEAMTKIQGWTWER